MGSRGLHGFAVSECRILNKKSQKELNLTIIDLIILRPLYFNFLQILR